MQVSVILRGQKTHTYLVLVYHQVYEYQLIVIDRWKKKTPFTTELPLRVLPQPNQNTNKKIAFWLLYFLRLFVFLVFFRDILK